MKISVCGKSKFCVEKKKKKGVFAIFVWFSLEAAKKWIEKLIYNESMRIKKKFKNHLRIKEDNEEEKEEDEGEKKGDFLTAFIAISFIVH